MNIKSALRATQHWVPFAMKTMGYGTLSITLGPWTREHKASLWAMRRWCQSSCQDLGIDVEISGLENVPEGAFVYCSNHQSIVDIIVLGSVLPGDYKWAAKRSVMNVPFLGWHLTLSGHVPVDRKAGPEAAARVITRFEETLRSGKPLLVFPEGTRSEDGIMKPLKRGSFIAAVRANVPVVPVAIEGTHKLMHKGAFDLAYDTPRKIAVKIGAPVQPRDSGDEEERILNLRDRTYSALLKLHASIGGTLPQPQSEELAAE